MKAPCPLFRKCSGCTRMQLPYVKQLRDKTQAARAALARFVPKGESADDVIEAVVPSPLELGYRTSSKLCLHEDEFGRRAIGLYERGTKKVVAIPRCPVHHPAINEMVQRLFGPKVPLPASFYNHAKRGFQAGKLKFVVIRHCPVTGNFGIVLSHTGVARAALVAWAEAVASPKISIYETTLAREDDDRILAEESQHLAGPKTTAFVIGSRAFDLSPLAFFQANAALAAPFVEHVVTGPGGKGLLDLYGGFGSYSLAMPKRYTQIHLVDANPHAIDAAKIAAKKEGIATLKAKADSAETYLERGMTAAERRDITHVIVNPPRGGLSPKVRAQLQSPRWPNLTALTYVSCNLETLERDLSALIRTGGFTLQSVRPFDMFPQTDHLELVVKLTRPPASARRAKPRGRAPSPSRQATTKNAKPKSRRPARSPSGKD